MKLIFEENQFFAELILGRSELIDGSHRNIIEVWSDEPMPTEIIDRIKNGGEFEDSAGRIYKNYNKIIRYATWISQVDPNDIIIEQMVQTNNKLAEDKGEAIEQKNDIQFNAIPILLRGKRDDGLIEVLKYIPEWTPMAYSKGDVRKHEDMPWICVMAHDATPHEDWTPGHAAMWAPYHAQSEEKALDWIAPTGMHDMYKAGEYMIFTDGKTYECLSDTNFSPVDSPTAWHDVAAGPTPDPEPEEPVDPEEPGAKNSNGTDIWSEWLAWDSNPATLYNVGDLVTHNGIRYISTQSGNHWEPGVYGWEQTA